MSTEDQSRSEFEAHMLALNACTRLHRQRESLGGHYRTTTVQRAWELWQASRYTYRSSVLDGLINDAHISASDKPYTVVMKLRAALAAQDKP